MKARKGVKIKTPCDRCEASCENGGNCLTWHKCSKWEAWFCAYWKKLREKHLPALREEIAESAENDAERGE